MVKIFRQPAWAIIALAAASSANCLADFPPLALKPISLTQIVSPVGITNAGDGSGRLFVCDQNGKVQIIRDEMLLPTPFLDLSAKLVALTGSYDERGLLSMTFHPNFNKLDGSNHPLPGYGKFYVFYSAPSPNAPGTTTAPVNCRSTISEFQVSATNPDAADPTTERVILSYDKPQANHNGGQLQFGPDGYLYISVGDGGGQHDNQYGHTGGSGTSSPGPSGVMGNAQDTTVLLGKILRIDPMGNNGPGMHYGIPGDNPFAGAGGGVRGEIWSFGMRNPWRFSFDDGPGGTGRLFEGDVGQDKVEEVNIITSGGNYGWRINEGTFSHDATAPSGGGTLISPIAQYAHQGVVIGSPALPQIGASITGGYVYRGSAIPALQGKYVFGDYSQALGSANGTLLGLEDVPLGSGNWVLSTLAVAGGNPLTTRIQAFGRDEQGELYVAGKFTEGPAQLSNGLPSGAIYKIVAANVTTVTLAPLKDNSIYSDFTSNSNAQGDLFAGNNAGSHPRRALLAFDIASNLPASAAISSATLSLYLNNSASSVNASMSLYKLTQAWGEGTSAGSGGGGQGFPATTGDATWTARLYSSSSPTLWTTAGGTHGATVSATATVGISSGYWSWTSTQLAADVQGWITSPSSNNGWILLGDETSAPTAREFYSREAAANVQPQLQLTYPVLPPLTRRESWLQQYFPVVGTYVDDTADPDGDGIPNLIEYAFAYSPTSANQPGSGFQTSVTQNGANQTFTVTFRRDPRATDLTYQLQTSPDLVNWNTITQSIGGAAPTGSGFVSETVAPGESPVMIVTAAETLAASANRFARLVVSRVSQ